MGAGQKSAGEGATAAVAEASAPRQGSMAGLGPRAQELAGRVAVVTGAGQGMGRAIARKLACRGACVAALDLNLAAVQETVSGMDEADAEGGGRRGHAALACDVGDSGAVDAAFERIEARTGPVSILVNNAGIGRAPNDGSERMYALMAKRNEELAVGGPARTHVDHIPFMEDAGWAGVLRVNLDGAFFCTRAAVRSMIKADRPGAIVSIASTAAQSGEGPVHYVTSKAALIGLTRALARELGSRGIRVNAVAPGPHQHAHHAGHPRTVGARHGERHSLGAHGPNRRKWPRRCAGWPATPPACVREQCLSPTAEAISFSVWRGHKPPCFDLRAKWCWSLAAAAASGAASSVLF